MAESQEYIRVSSPDQPNRCQANIKHGQCQIIASPGSPYCRLHGGSEGVIERIEAKNYRLSKWQTRVQEFADSDKVKSLREEIGLLRIMLEEIVNRCETNVDLIINSGKIADLVVKVEKLVVSCHRLEERTGMLLDKSAALRIADNIITIIGKYVAADRVDEIALQILETVVNENGNTSLVPG